MWTTLTSVGAPLNIFSTETGSQLFWKQHECEKKKKKTTCDVHMWHLGPAVPVRCTPTASWGSPAQCEAEDPEWQCTPSSPTSPVDKTQRVVQHHAHEIPPKNILLTRTLFIYLDETGVDVVCVILSRGQREFHSAVVNWGERNVFI